MEDKNQLFMDVETGISLSSVILSAENRDKIEEFTREYKYGKRFKAYGLDPMNRLLFFGASGTGKTYLAKALANDLGFTMLYVDIAKSLSDGNVAKNISEIFETANRLKKCILFFDEADSIAWNRDSITSESGVVRRATNSIFQSLDQMDVSNVFIAATNMLHRLDPAFERRFNLKLEFRRPEETFKASIKKFKHKDFVLLDDVDKTVQDIVERRKTLSYYEIKGVVERAMKRAIMNETNIIKTSDIYKDLAIAMRIKVKFGTDSDDEVTFKSSIF